MRGRGLVMPLFGHGFRIRHTTLLLGTGAALEIGALPQNVLIS